MSYIPKLPDIHAKTKSLLLKSDTTPVIKLIDFGSCKAASSQSRKALTLINMSPEQIQGQSQDCRKDDMFAFGIIAYQMFTKSHPFFKQGMNLPMVWSRIERGVWTGFATSDKPAAYLVSNLLKTKDRWTIEKVLQHPYFNKAGKY